jgi:hypothetical protein
LVEQNNVPSEQQYYQVNSGTMYLLQLAKECTMKINIPVIKFLQIEDENYNTDYGTEVSKTSKCTMSIMKYCSTKLDTNNKSIHNNMKTTVLLGFMYTLHSAQKVNINSWLPSIQTCGTQKQPTKISKKIYN